MIPQEPPETKDTRTAPQKKAAARALQAVTRAVGKTADSAYRLPSRLYKLGDDFMSSFNNDHKFWTHTLGMKGGFASAIAAATIGMSYALTLPVALAASAVVACTMIVGLGLYAAYSGFGIFSQSIRQAYHRVRGTEMPPPKDGMFKKLGKKIGGSRAWNSLKNSKAVRMLNESKAAKVAQSVASRMGGGVLGGFAVGGPVLSMGIAAWVLSAQLVALPVFAIGGLLTFTSIYAVTGIVGGVLGISFAVRNVNNWRRDRKAARAEGGAGVQANMNAAEVNADASADVSADAACTDAATTTPALEDKKIEDKKIEGKQAAASFNAATSQTPANENAASKNALPEDARQPKAPVSGAGRRKKPTPPPA